MNQTSRVLLELWLILPPSSFQSGTLAARPTAEDRPLAEILAASLAGDVAAAVLAFFGVDPKKVGACGKA